MKNFFLTYKNPLSATLVLIILGGFFIYGKFQTALFPEITFPKIKVIAEAGLQPVDRMMITVTKPLEDAIKKIPGLESVRSTTGRGSCEISAFIDEKTDLDLSQQRIESRINEIRDALPREVHFTVEKMNPSILPVMGYTIESRSRSPIELKLLASYVIKPFLSQVRGVSEIRIIGGKTKEYWLTLNMQKMSSLSVTPDMINTVLSQTGFIRTTGYVTDYRFLYLTLTDASVHTKEDVEHIVVSNNGKRIILLKDIADVSVQEAVEYTRINANGREGILVAVIKQPGANLLDISSAMKARVKALESVLPKDVTLEPYYIQADFVQDAVKSVTDSLWIGLVLAILVVIIFLRSLKASFTILVTVPVTLCLSLLVLYAAGYSLNIMTLGAVAASIGLIIDDAIVVMEQIHRTHEEHPGEDGASLVKKAISYLFPAMVGSSISTIVIFIPFAWMTGVAGAYFKVLTNTMIILLVCSFFITWIALPVIYLWFKQKPRIVAGRKPSGKNANIKTRGWISFFIHRPYISFLFIGALAVSVYFILPRLETGFLPEMDEGSIILDYNTAPGTSLQETDRVLREVEKIISAEPDVAAYSRRTGTEMGFFITEPNRGDYLIQLKKTRERSTEDVISALRKKIESSEPALQRVDFGQVITDMLGDLMTSVQPIEIKIFGNDQGKILELSRTVAEVVSEVKGMADVSNGIVIAGPSVTVMPDYSRLAQFGLSPASLQFQLQLAMQGTVAGTLPEKEQLTNLRVVYPNNRNITVNEIGKMQIFLPNGKLKPIAELATVKINAGDAEIKRENLQSMGVVTGRLDSVDLGTAISEIKKQISRKVVLPQDMHIEYGGAYAEQQKSFSELLVVLITSSLLVFGVILFLFRDFKVALLILLIAVLGISGSYLALYFSQTALNVGSYTGLIMIVGIIGENAIFTFLQFRETLRDHSVEESIIYAISTRLRPKLMTAIGAIIALAPLALGIGTGAELHRPLAIAVIGGFLIALPLLLIVFPSLLALFYRKSKPV